MSTGTIINYCSHCGKKPTSRRTIDQQTALCQECSPKHDDSNKNNNNNSNDAGANAPDPNDNITLNNVTFGTLKSWLNSAYADHVTKLEEKLTAEIGIVRQDLETTNTVITETRTEVTKLKKDLSDRKTCCEKSARELDERIKTLEEESAKQKTVSDNNLKYLINADRNVRRSNVIIFGVPETNTNLEINNNTAITDEEKCKMILNYIGTPIYDSVSEMFRLGKTLVDDKPRPIKLKFPSSLSVSSVLKESKKLKNLPNITIYIKPDKTKSEVAEFKRLGKRKTELSEQYPVGENGVPRVTLEKGILKVDGVHMDEFKSAQTLF